jgi:SAM-dependent methyltransferase
VSEDELTPMSAAEWDAAYRRGNWVWDEPPPSELAELIQHYQPPPATLLDLGCGVGTTARSLAIRGYSVFGCDQSAIAIAAAREADTVNGRCEFATLDFLTAADQLPDAELVIDRGVLHTRPSRRSQAEFVAVVARICRPGRIWVHIGISASEAEGSSFFVHGPSALTETDFHLLVQDSFTLLESRAIRYGKSPGETDLPARIAVLRRLDSPAQDG